MKRPNILYFMSDDHASNAISCYNSRLASVFKTPNFDRLAEEGMKMENFFATNSICTPARANIMTGQYGHINGVKTLSDRWDVANADVNIAQLIHDSGYTTAMFGKWHLACVPVGFDDYKYLSDESGITGGQGVYRNPTFNEKHNGFTKHEGYATDIITDLTVDWLKNRDKDKPFFVMCHHKAPHDMWDYAERFEHIFDGMDIPEPESLFEDLSHRSEGSREWGSRVSPTQKSGCSLYDLFSVPNYVTGSLVCDPNDSIEEKTRKTYQKYLKDYLRTVAGIDDSVGTIMKELEEQGELDNTVIIYTSDQGMFLGEHDYIDKRWSYEESLRSPFLIRYPKEIKAQSVQKNLACNVDVAPLLLDFAGVEIPQAIQGVSFRNMLSDENAEVRDSVYFRYWMHMAHHGIPAHYGIRTKDYKLMFYYGLSLDSAGCERWIDQPTQTGWELYDFANDPYELHNIYNDEKYKDVVIELKAKLMELKVKYKDTDDMYPEVAKRVAESE